MHWLKQTLIYSPFGFYQDHTFQLLLNLEQTIDTINLSGKCLLRSWCHRCLLYNQISFWNQSCCHLLADLRQSCSFTFLEAALISNTVFSGQMCIFNCKFLYQTQFYTSSAIMTKKRFLICKEMQICDDLLWLNFHLNLWATHTARLSREQVMSTTGWLPTGDHSVIQMLFLVCACVC